MTLDSSEAMVGSSLSTSTWRTVYLDDHILVVNKDSGLLTVPGKGPGKKDSLLERLKHKNLLHPSAHAAHRLDRDTSGLVVFGRSKSAHRYLSVQFQEKRVEKIYEALVWGCPAVNSGVVDLPIGKILRGGQTHAQPAIDEYHGRTAITRWKIDERCALSSSADSSPLRPFCRISLEPVTGRSHQLRLHMLALNLPIIGDQLHTSTSADTSYLANRTKHTDLAEVKLQVNQLCLHARDLSVQHPTSGEWMTFHSESPF